MVFRLEISDQALADLQTLDVAVAKRIATKLRWFAAQTNPLRFAEHLTDSPYGQYRFRIGDYRAMFDVKRGIIMVLEILRIKHRNVAYNR